MSRIGVAKSLSGLHKMRDSTVLLTCSVLGTGDLNRAIRTFLISVLCTFIARPAGHDSLHESGHLS
jgi:hypothetical protein